MSFLLASMIAIGVGSLFLGLLIYFSDSKNSANKIFTLFSLVVVMWIISTYLVDHPIVNEMALFWNKLNFASAISMAIVIFYFSFYFPKKSNFPTTWKILYFIISLILILLILFTNLGIEKIEFLDWGTNASSGHLFYPGLVWAIISIVGLFINIGVKYKNLDSNEKLQLKYLIYGLILSIIFGLSSSALLPIITGQYEYAKFAPVGMIFLIGFTAYAILKHQLFNIKVILTETAVGLVVLAIFIQTLSSKTIGQGLFNGIILILVIYGGYLVIKSVLREIKFRQELQMLTDQLAKANAHLKDLDKMKTEFVSLASHELLTPVSAIEGYLSMILDEHLAKVDDPKAAQYLDRIYRSSRRLARLIADMLNISRIEEGRLMVEKKDVNLNELIKQTIDELKFKAEERKQRVVFEDIANKLRDSSATPQNDNYMTYADPDKIKEVIVNIIGNSIKYSKDPGTISIHIEKAPTEKVQEIWAKIEDKVKDQPLDDQEAIKASVNEYYRQFVGKEQLLIIVKDQGIGIPKEELTKLFKKFHRVGDYSTEESQGTGLGLYISRSLVELHHGRIWADSEGRGKGSTFTFSLPDISDKEALLEIEKQVPNQKEQLKPLAKPMNEKIGEDI